MTELFAYVGCRTTAERNARGQGISTYRIDASGAWHLLGVLPTGPNPSYLALDPQGAWLFAVHGDHSAISSYRIGRDGLPAPEATFSTCGLNPVHLALDPSGRFVVVVNHQTSALAVLPRGADGSLERVHCYRQISGALGPHRSEQTAPKPHQAVFTPDGRKLLVPCKGSDQLLCYGFDAATGMLSDAPVDTLALREGSGPRTLALTADGRRAFLSGELDSTLSVVDIAVNGMLKARQVLSTLPDSCFAMNRAATVWLAHDERALFVSNRGHDTICRFDIAQGRLSNPDWLPSGGRTPRFITGVSGAQGLYVANEDSDIISLLDPGNGTVVAEVPTPSPVCVVFRG